MEIKLKDMSAIMFNGTDLTAVVFGDVTVWTKEIIVAIKRFVGGNWKMNLTRETASDLVQEFVSGINALGALNVTVVLFPQACLIPVVSDLIADLGATGKIKVGAQLCAPREKGAYTGQNSVEALMSCGAKYFLVANEEVSTYLGTNNDSWNPDGNDATKYIDQLKLVVDNGGTVLYGVPEDLEQYNGGTWAQGFQDAIQLLSPIANKINAGNTIICYEPVWSIGTGKQLTADILGARTTALRNIVKQVLGNSFADVTIVHDGSVTPNNFADQLAQPDVNGALAGGISLRSDFVQIVNIANQ